MRKAKQTIREAEKQRSKRSGKAEKHRSRKAEESKSTTIKKQKSKTIRKQGRAVSKNLKKRKALQTIRQAEKQRSKRSGKAQKHRSR